MDGVRIYFEIELNEKEILADGYNQSDLKLMYGYMDEAFAAHDCYLEQIEDKKRIYTRNVDNKDMGYLWMAANLIEKKNWFEKYACHYMFHLHDEDYSWSDAEEDWLEEIRLRRSYRLGVYEIVSDMKKIYGDNPEGFFMETSGCCDNVKRLLSETSYQMIEEDEFILCHKKDFSDYQEGMRLISVSLERCEMAGIASLICLMQKNEIPDSVMIAFLKNTEDKKLAVQKLIKLLGKTKKKI